MLGSPVRPRGKALQSGRLRVKDPWSDQQEQGWRLKGKGWIFLRSGSDSTHLPFSSQRTAAKPDMMTMISSAHICVVYTCEHTCFHVCRHMCACMHACVEIRGGCQLLSTLCSEVGPLTWTQSLPIQWVQLASCLWWSMSLPIQCWCWDLNSGSHVCVANASPTKFSPQPSFLKQG